MENTLFENILLETTLSENTLLENTLSENTLSENALPRIYAQIYSVRAFSATAWPILVGIRKRV